MTPKLKCQMRLNALRRIRISERIGELERQRNEGGDYWTREELSRANSEYCDLHREWLEFRRQM